MLTQESCHSRRRLIKCSSVPSDDPDNAVTIDADGSVSVGPQALKRLAAHAGEFRIVPSTGGLVILQRIGGEGQPGAGSTSSLIPPGRVTLAGAIDTSLGMVDMINFVHGNSWSGQLSVVDATVR